MSYHLALTFPCHEDSKLLPSTPYDFYEGATGGFTPRYVSPLQFLLRENLVGHELGGYCVDIGVLQNGRQKPL